ncbi:MAG TPA: 30S ribosomal protein S17 [Candidatus Moranbacteria bacterium]|nr:30S ribosomal protein S17 [Candidatus Moranbacteria bacterium]
MANNQKKDKIIARKKGRVVSDKMDKTVVVAVDIFKTHPKYKKKYKSTKRYKAHSENNKYKVGDKVEIVAVKPISKDKKYKVFYKK